MRPNNIICGNVLDVLASWPAECVDMAITSPPYWGLRSYDGEHQVWGGEKNCQHEFVWKPPIGGKNHPKRPANVGANRSLDDDDVRGRGTKSDFCNKCNAWRGQLGLEPDFKMFISHLVEIFRAVRRVLKPGGSLWVNMGDSYSGSGQGWSKKGEMRGKNSIDLRPNDIRVTDKPNTYQVDGVKAKSLCLIPERFAIAMVDDGWILRNKIVWAKQILFQDGTTRGAVMPSSVKDRFNQSSEYLYFFTKTQKYYFDLDTVRVPFTESGIKRVMGYHEGQYQGDCKEKSYHTQLPFGCGGDGNKPSRILARAKNKLSSCDCQQCRPRMGNRGGQETLYDSKSAPEETKLGPKDFETEWEYCQYKGKGYYRTVGGEKHSWEREGFKLQEGVPGREPCGFERKGHSGNCDKEGNSLNHPMGKNPPTVWAINTQPFPEAHFATFPPGLIERPIKVCCPPGGLVLDPFMGAGTTALTAKILGRHFVGIELSQKYIDIAMRRLEKEVPLFLGNSQTGVSNA